MRPGGILHPLDHLAAVRRRGDLIRDQADRLRALLGKAAGEGVRPPAQFVDRGPDSIARRLWDVGAGRIIYDERHGRLRHAGRPGHVVITRVAHCGMAVPGRVISVSIPSVCADSVVEEGNLHRRPSPRPHRRW